MKVFSHIRTSCHEFSLLIYVKNTQPYVYMSISFSTYIYIHIYIYISLHVCGYMLVSFVSLFMYSVYMRSLPNGHRLWLPTLTGSRSLLAKAGTVAGT